MSYAAVGQTTFGESLKKVAKWSATMRRTEAAKATAAAAAAASTQQQYAQQQADAAAADAGGGLPFWAYPLGAVVVLGGLGWYGTKQGWF